MSLPAFTTPSTLFMQSTTPSTRFVINTTKGHQIPLGNVKEPFTEEQIIYSTPFLKALETVTALTVLLVSSFLLTILLTGTRRFTVGIQRHRYKIMCLICFGISTAETYFVITASKMSREFVEEIGFVDHLDYAKPYEISCLVSLAIALISVLLHLAIIIHVRYYHRTNTETTGK
ncbi:hypothetical protein GCK32_003114, partial [Trichostrongylus colubriformis]